MNIRRILGLIALASTLLFSSCSGSKEQSAKTGWNINDPKWGGFELNLNYEQPTPSDMVFVEGGSFLMGKNQEDVYFDYNNIPRRVTVSSFFIDEIEVRNYDYNEYLYWLDRIYGQEYPEVVRQAYPDELCWRRVNSYVEDMVNNYLRHPTYKDYPVVGVTWEQANDYCIWRTDRVNERILIEKGILEFDPAQTADNHFNTEAYLAGQYEGLSLGGIKDLNPNAPEKVRKVRFEDGILMPNYRLPTEAEWEYAAYGLIGNTYDERVVERKLYPWNGPSVRMDDKTYMGQMRANFARGRGDYMGVAGNLNDGSIYTSTVYSYAPNDFGLYNMAGNVAEWVMDVYRPLTFEDANEANPIRGNIYMTKVRDEDGLIAEKDSLGRIRQRVVTTEESANRRNYQKGDNRNFDDGDFKSSVSDDWTATPEDASSTSGLVYDPRTSLITDRSRVVKGGSFQDRAYWLSPGGRRFLEQDQCEAWIGFRCAMSRIGSQSKSSAQR